MVLSLHLLEGLGNTCTVDAPLEIPTEDFRTRVYSVTAKLSSSVTFSFSWFRYCWAVTLCSLVDGYQCFGTTYCLSRQGQRWRQCASQKCFVHLQHCTVSQPLGPQKYNDLLNLLRNKRQALHSARPHSPPRKIPNIVLIRKKWNYTRNKQCRPITICRGPHIV
jgi:hypothetical protein